MNRISFQTLPLVAPAIVVALFLPAKKRTDALPPTVGSDRNCELAPAIVSSCIAFFLNVVLLVAAVAESSPRPGRTHD